MVAPNLQEKLKLEKEKRQLESKRDGAWHEYGGAAQVIENKKSISCELAKKREIFGIIYFATR